MSCGSRARSCSSWTRAGRRCHGPQRGFPRDSLFFSFHLAGISQIFYFCEQGILFLDCKDCLGVAGEDGRGQVCPRRRARGGAVLGREPQLPPSQNELNKRFLCSGIRRTCCQGWAFSFDLLHPWAPCKPPAICHRPRTCREGLAARPRASGPHARRSSPFPARK